MIKLSLFNFRDLSTFCLTLCLALLVVSCSVKPKAQSRYQANFDFKTAKSYSLYYRNSVFSDYQNLSDTDRNSVELAIEQAFDARGFAYKEPEQADFIITYFVSQNSRRDLARYNQGVRYCRYCLQEYDDDSKELSVKPFGTFIVDLVDTKTKRSVWRAVSDIRLSDKDNSQELQVKFEQALVAMLSQYPGQQLLQRAR